MIETISVPPGSSMVTSVLTAPCSTPLTLPLKTLRALIFIGVVLSSVIILKRSLTGPHRVDPVNIPFKPADGGFLTRVEGGHIRFEVQQRCTIHDIYIFDVQGGPLNPYQAHNGEANRVGAFRRAGRKDAMGL